MAVKVLKDDALDANLEKEGYVVIPFLNTEEVQYLNELYTQKITEPQQGMYATAHSSNPEFKKMMSQGILDKFTRAIDEVFFESRPLGGSYITKYKGDKGVLFPHQDWNIVDEDHYRSFNIWVPLCDTNDANGAIAVLPHSHKLLKSYRGVNIPDPFYKINSHTWQHHTTLYMKAGEALIYDHRLLHASGINTTDTPRVAVVFGIIPQAADMRYYYMNNGVVEEYQNEVGFFFDKNILLGPQGLQKLQDINYTMPDLTNEDFDEMYLGIPKPKPRAEPAAEVQVAQKPSIFNRLLKAIGI
ncbi:MAG: phytanoyl-CoA dioxygenase family protein [Bacteroidetes bacterium]|nr:phytanoyl-CoA dioxygenase family protein [Bacteroidota bacterium]